MRPVKRWFADVIRPVQPRCLMGMPITLAALAALLFLMDWPARADVRQAAGKAVPATVCVQWETEAADVDAHGSAHHRPDSIALSSGTAVSADGLIVTCVGEPGQKGQYKVTLTDGRETTAELLVDDRRCGLRLLRINFDDLSHLRLAEEDAAVGQELVAAVCVDGTRRAVRRGIVSMTDCWIPNGRMPLLLSDMTVGNMAAGAPLVDADGRLVGIVTARRRSQESPDTLAISVGYVAALIEARQAENTVIVHPGLLGVEIESSDTGATRVVQVISQSPAEKAGLAPGDVILEIDGRKVTHHQDVVDLIGRRTAGSRVTVTLQREGKEQSVEATLDRRPGPAKPPEAEPLQVELVYPDHLEWIYRNLGLTQSQTRALEAERLLIAAQLKDVDRDALQRARQFLNRAGSAAVERPTVRVSRSDADGKIDRLRKDVDVLSARIEELTGELKKLREELRKQRPADRKP